MSNDLIVNQPFSTTGGTNVIENAPAQVTQLSMPSTGGTDITDVVIYYNTSGSDTSGNGTVGNPYLTIARAYQDIPLDTCDTRYLVAGNGGTQAPLNILKSHRSNVSLTTSYTFGGFTFRSGAINFFSAPTLVTTVSSATSSAEAGSGIVTWTSSGTPYTAHAFEGMFVNTSGENWSVVVDNTTNSITLADAGTITLPFNIYSLTATLQATASTSRALAVNGGSAGLGFFGIGFNNTASGTSVALSSGDSNAFFTACSFGQAAIISGAGRALSGAAQRFEGCYFGTNASGVENSNSVAAHTIERSFFDNGSFGVLSFGGASTIGSSYFSNCGIIEQGGTVASISSVSIHGTPSGTNGIDIDTGATLTLLDFFITGTGQDGIVAGTQAGSVRATTGVIQNCGEYGIQGLGPSMVFGSISGTGNAVFGLYSQGVGSKVQIIDANMTVTGASGDARAGFPPAFTWASYYGGSQYAFDAFGNASMIVGPGGNAATNISPQQDNLSSLGSASYRLANINAVHALHTDINLPSTMTPATPAATTVTLFYNSTAGAVEYVDSTSAVYELGVVNGPSFQVTSASEGFFGATPVVQPTGGPATAGAVYTSVEQGMINAMYTAMRALGLLS